MVMVIVLSPPLDSEFNVANCTLEKLAVACADPCRVIDCPPQSTLVTEPNADCHAIPTTTDRPEVVPVRVTVNELLPLVMAPVLGPTVIAIATRLPCYVQAKVKMPLAFGVIVRVFPEVIVKAAVDSVQ